MKKVISTILAVVLLLSVGITISPATAEDTAVKKVIMATDSLDGSMDPAGFALSTWNGFARFCSAPLLSFSETGEEIMGAAESYSISDDQLTWTFNLRADALWSDGTPVVSADFLNTIHRALDPETSSSIYAEMLYCIVGAAEAHQGTGSMDAVQALGTDDYTLVFTLTAPCPYFTKLLSLPVFYPSKAGVATNENKTWFKDPATCPCNGPFMLTEYVQDQSYTVSKNPYYWDAANVKIDEFVNKVISDTQSTIAAYESGEINSCSGLPDYIAIQYADSPELNIWHMLTTTAILPNVEVEPLDNKLVREALAIALSRDVICASMGSNYEASYNWVPKYMLSNVGDKYFSEEVTPFAEDQAKAKELLAEAGYPNGEGFPTLSYIYPSSDKDNILAQAIQAQLKAVLNIDITLEAQEYEVYNSTKRDSSFQLLRYNWTADFNDPINYLSLWTSDSSLNFNNVNDPAYDAAIEGSNTASDAATRNAFLHEAEEVLINQNFYVIPLSTMHYIGLRNANITGLTYNDKGEAYYTYADITE